MKPPNAGKAEKAAKAAKKAAEPNLEDLKREIEIVRSTVKHWKTTDLTFLDLLG